MVKTIIERGTRLDLTGRVGFDGHEANHQAILDGKLWVYAEYTGTALRRYLKRTAGTNPDQVYQIVRRECKKRWKLVWLSRFGFNNTYAILMRASRARQLGIRRISQLATHAPSFTLAASEEFLKGDPNLRFAVGGYPRFAATYGFEFGKTLAVNAHAAFSLVGSRKADVGTGFATDFRLVHYDLTDLQDDREFFSPYEAAPVVRGDFLARHPAVASLLKRLEGKISNRTMACLNFKVAAGQQRPRDVAQAFLANISLPSGLRAHLDPVPSPSDRNHQPQGAGPGPCSAC